MAATEKSVILPEGSWLKDAAADTSVFSVPLATGTGVKNFEEATMAKLEVELFFSEVPKRLKNNTSLNWVHLNTCAYLL